MECFKCNKQAVNGDIHCKDHVQKVCRFKPSCKHYNKDNKKCNDERPCRNTNQAIFYETTHCPHWLEIYNSIKANKVVLVKNEQGKI